MASASPFTLTSPTGGTLPVGVTEIGGIVLDLTGTNGARVVSQVSASSLFKGYFSTGTPKVQRSNSGIIGVQSGFTPAIVSALGGGLTGASVRLTLDDGDTALGNFDHNDNFLLLNSIAFGANGGNFSSVEAETTNSLGAVTGTVKKGSGTSASTPASSSRRTPPRWPISSPP